MVNNRLRSIVPMFGGGASYVESLDAILEFVEAHEPTTDELVGWHRGQFANVSSRDSIMRRVRYLHQVGFIREEDDRWLLDQLGRDYLADQDVETLYRIMCDRNVGLRSLLYELSAREMTIGEISEQQLETHPDLGWSPGETDMAKQRANWLRSMGLVEKRGDVYQLTDEGREFVDRAVEAWAETELSASETIDAYTAGTYETVVTARAIDPEFRATVLSSHNQTCPVSGVDHPRLLDVAHVLPWSDYPDHRADLSNVLPLSKTHHAAFDQELFTIDHDYRLHVNPEFETGSDLLQRSIIRQAGNEIPLAANSVDPEYLSQHNSSLSWF